MDCNKGISLEDIKEEMLRQIHYLLLDFRHVHGVSLIQKNVQSTITVLGVSVFSVKLWTSSFFPVKYEKRLEFVELTTVGGSDI
ncbi:hypothetical protein V6N13_108169 [Hibiscus sabdariffa]|uniref:Uncharacterized protein n=1 Tax=Hibiscus sabdariffa TaxID=183260 RepID=A0ABR2SRF9_9ROSI